MGLISDAAVSRGDFGRRLADQEQTTTEIRTARRGQHTSVGSDGMRFHSGGGITIVDGGDFRVVDANGQTIVALGRLSGGSIGWSFLYDTGKALFNRQGTPGQQFWAFWDQSDNIVLSNDAVTGAGLARPYLTMRMVPSPVADWPVSTATSAVAATKVWQGVNVIENPRIVIGVNMVSDAGTPHWRLDIDGVTVEADNTGIGSFTFDIPGWRTDINPGDAVGIDLYGWVTGGGTQMQMLCDRLHGDQS